MTQLLLKGEAKMEMPKILRVRGATRLIALFVALVAWSAAAPVGAQSSSIEGTWELVSRTLPDGQVVKHPDIQGVLNFAGGYRNINLLFRAPDGSWGSYSAVASYKISSNRYRETLHFVVAKGLTPDNATNYDVPGVTKSSPIERKGGRVQIQPPFDPPTWVFEGDSLTATLEGAFVDSWRRVK
jgi:hypothetical protein